MARHAARRQGGPAGASLARALLRRAGREKVVRMSEISRLLILIGSVRDGRFGPVVASWVAGRAREHGAFEVDLMDLAEVEIPLALPSQSPKMAGNSYPRPVGMADLTSRLAAADAFVLVTPEYNHSYPASIKAAIDWHFTHGKPSRSSYWANFKDGQPLDPQAPEYAKVMLEQLAWWATALRKARSESVYPG